MFDKEFYANLFDKYLNKTISDAERLLLNDFILHNPALDKWMQEELMNTSHIISEATRQKMWEVIQAGTGIQSSEKKTVVRKFRTTELLKWAAILLLPIMAIWMTHRYDKKHLLAHNPVRIIADRGEKAMVTLPDGSKVWINSESAISYDHTYNQDNRIVTLEGQAYFDVHKDAEKPFIVRTKKLDVQALGTRFDVKAFLDEHDVTVILHSGKVKVSNDVQNFYLLPNEMLVFNTLSGNGIKQKVFAEDYSAWKSGKIRFNNESIEDIAKTLSRIYNVKIVVASESLKSQRFTGTIGNNGLKNNLDIFSMTSTLDYRMDDSTIVLIEKGK